jgi:hypothetical protein
MVTQIGRCAYEEVPFQRVGDVVVAPETWWELAG